MRKLYSQAKWWSWFRVILAIGVPIVASLVNLNSESRSWTAFFCVVAVCLDRFWLDVCEDNNRSMAAKIQELFDCNVLKISWNKVLIGQQPTLDNIQEKSMDVKSKFKDRLKGWYPQDLSFLQSHEARIFCQWENCWWDLKLRNQYKKWLLFVMIIVAVIVVLLAMNSEMSFRDFVLNLAVLLFPVFLWGILECRRHKRACIVLEYLVDFTTNILQESRNGLVAANDVDKHARQVQDRIFLLRSSNPFIPDWVYRIKQPKFEKLMKEIVKEMMN